MCQAIFIAMKRTRLNPISEKRQSESQIYKEKATEFLRKFPWCAYSLRIHGRHIRATQIHHILRRGKYYLDESTWLPVSAFGHNEIERHPAMAREYGWLYNPDIHGSEKNPTIIPFSY